MTSSLTTSILNLQTPNQLRSNSPKHSTLLRKSSLAFVGLDDTPFSVPTTWPTELLLAFYLQYIFGLRVSELLGIRCSDISRDGLCKITGTKKSRNRIIFFPFLLSYCRWYDIKPDHKLFNWTYRQYYLHLKRAGISFKIRPDSQNHSVTHFGRHYRFKSSKADFCLPDLDLAAFTGHKSLKGLRYYTENDLNVPGLRQAATAHKKGYIINTNKPQAITKTKGGHHG